uniref:Uncharacterized protein n=1 Tax=Arundo donax TaxID=35708 RepID=A0A0A9EV32_ARUDO
MHELLSSVASLSSSLPFCLLPVLTLPTSSSLTLYSLLEVRSDIQVAPWSSPLLPFSWVHNGSTSLSSKTGECELTGPSTEGSTLQSASLSHNISFGLPTSTDLFGEKERSSAFD